MNGIAVEVVAAIFALGTEVMKLALEAIKNGDPKALKKVTDILPKGHKLQLELVSAAEAEKQRKRLEKLGHK